MPEGDEAPPAAPKFGFVQPMAEEENLDIRDEITITVEPGEITLYWACLIAFNRYMEKWISLIPDMFLAGKLSVTQTDGSSVQYQARYDFEDMKREQTVAFFQDLPGEILDTPKVRDRLKTEALVAQNWHTSSATGLAIINVVGFFVEECNLVGKSINDAAAGVRAETIRQMGIQLGASTTTFTILENQLGMLREIGKLFTEIHHDNPELVAQWFGPPPTGNLQFFCEKFFSINRAFERNLLHPDESERAALFVLAEEARKRMEADKGGGGGGKAGPKQQQG